MLKQGFKFMSVLVFVWIGMPIVLMHTIIIPSDGCLRHDLKCPAPLFRFDIFYKPIKKNKIN